MWWSQAGRSVEVVAPQYVLPSAIDELAPLLGAHRGRSLGELVEDTCKGHRAHRGFGVRLGEEEAVLKCSTVVSGRVAPVPGGSISPQVDALMMKS